MCDVLGIVLVLAVGGGLGWWQTHRTPPTRFRLAPPPPLTECRIRRVTFHDRHTEEWHSYCRGRLDEELFRTVPHGARVITDTAHWVP